jgi:ethanolamine utilization protein EutN
VKLGKVVGTVVSTINHPFYDARRLLICDLITLEGVAEGYIIAVDTVDAGAGETVLILDEGNSSRQIFDIPTGPIRSTIVGVVDEVTVEE